MAVFYLSSVDGNDADNGSTWALAKATLAGAFAAMAAGDTLYVDDAHNEATGAAITATSPGTAASPCRVICVSRSTGAPPTAVATSAVVSNNANATLDLRGYAYVYGVTFKSGAGGSNNSANIRIGSSAAYWWRFEQGVLWINSTNATPSIQFGANNTAVTDELVDLVSSTVRFGATGQSIRVIGNLTWRGGGVHASSTAPTALIVSQAGISGEARLLGVDLSVLAGSSAIVDVSTASPLRVLMADVKLGSSVAVTTGTHAGQSGPVVTLINGDSSDTNYRYSRTTYRGTETQETTVVRTGGASDGATTVSRKIVTTANASAIAYYRSEPMEFWSASGSISVSIPTITDGVTLTDAEAWLELEGLGTSGYPLGTFASDRVSDPIFGTPANQATDSTSTWGGSLGSPVKQTLDASITTQKAGLIRAYVCVAKASTTVYYDPKGLSTSGRQYMSEAGMVNEGAAGGGGGPVIGGRLIQ